MQATTATNISIKKINIAQRLFALDDASLLDKVEQLLNSKEATHQIQQYAEVPTKTNIDALLAAQAYSTQKLINVSLAWDYTYWNEEPLEELLQTLSDL